MTGGAPTVAVLGAGHGGHAMAGHLALAGLRVNVYNRSPDRIAAIREQGGVWVEGAVQGFGRVSRVTTDLVEALADADLVMVVVPASAHCSLARTCAPCLRAGQVVVLNPGRTGGALEFAHALRQACVTARLYLAETESLVYSCRLVEPGRVRILSLKRRVRLAALPAADTRSVLALLAPLYPQFVPAANVLETSLGNIGTVFHPALMILQAAAIETGQRVRFYSDITPSLARFLEAVDRERLLVTKAFGVQAELVRDWLVRVYGDVGGHELYTRIRNVPAYQAALAPSTLDDRYLSEDVPYGLVPLAALAGVAGVPTPLSRALVHVAGVLLSRDFWAKGRTLERLGVQGLGLQEIIAHVTTQGCVS